MAPCSGVIYATGVREVQCPEHKAALVKKQHPEDQEQTMRRPSDGTFDNLFQCRTAAPLPLHVPW